MSTALTSPAGIRRERVHDGLLLCPPVRALAALRMLTTAVAEAHAETVVVCAASVAGRDDLDEVIALAMADDPRPARPIRLVLLGPPPAGAGTLFQATAARLGRTVIAPSGAVTVGSDGTCAVTASGRERGAWMVHAPDRAPRREPPWSPSPDWPAPRELRVAGGRIEAHAVPAGVWLLPAGARPGRAGVVPALPRVPGRMAVFIGGAAQAVASADVEDVLDAMALPPSTDVVLLPRALQPGSRLSPSRAAIAAVPALDPGGWRLARITPEGWYLPLDAVAVPTVDAPAWPFPDEAPSDPAGADGTTPQGPGRPTAAGWSFVDRPALGVARASGSVLVEVDGARHGFLVDGRRIAARDFAGTLRRVAGVVDTQLVLVGYQHSPRALRELARILAVDLLTGERASLTASGVLECPDGFRQWPSGRRVPGTYGDPVPLDPIGLASELNRRPPSVPEDPARAAPAPRGITIAPARCDADDLRSLEIAIGAGFAAHAEHIQRRLPSLSREPDDRATAAMAGLVALRSYWSGERGRVNRALRGEVAASEALRTIAACTLAGLDRMPLLFGPVFAAGPVADVSGYVAGTTLTEPAFVDLTLSPVRPDGPGIDYVIWSVSARRLGLVVHDAPATGIFAPGRRFVVLGRERVADRERVYLAESGAGVSPVEVHERLREAATRAAGDGDPVPTVLIGLAGAVDPWA